jgi:predicted methyltransferase
MPGIRNGGAATMKYLAATLIVLSALPAAAQQRPAEDVARDAARKPMEMVAFAGIKPGQTVADFLPGGGYFTRIFSTAVGASGKVVAVVPAAAEAANPERFKAVREMASTGWANVSFATFPLDPAMAGRLDHFWTAQNYHDLHNSMTPEAVIEFNKAVLAALKPGGTYVVIDHVALPGSGLAATRTLHRIDPDIIKAEITAAGFKFDGESQALRNPGDPRNVGVRDPSIRGETDQIVYRFKKP